jgi:hypothetical protein
LPCVSLMLPIQTTLSAELGALEQLYKKGKVRALLEDFAAQRKSLDTLP